MKIRKLTISDYEEMVRLWSKAKLPFKPKGRDSKKAIAAQMKTNPEFFLGAFEDNRLVGTVIISCDLRKGWINRLAVDPDYRHRGVAKALIAESEKILRKYGIRIFCVLIEDYNTVSKKLFKECNYIEHSDITYFSKRDSDEV
ncbi:MAG: GNAT family N-acetyltransferase [Candidatus Bathyarchaeia archaeon]|nr:GNAT family N-acetyltransferase [Candidatus Bathyarchaeia archaeon]